MWKDSTFFKRNYIQNIFFIILLIVVTFSVYSNSLHGDFLIDDTKSILANTRAHNLKEYFSKYFKPRLNFLFELDTVLYWHFFKTDTFGYHLVSVISHITCVLMIFALCNVLFKNKALSFLSSLIFAVHPIHTEAVSWISGRFYVISSVFYIASFIFYVKSYKSIFYLFLSILFFAICLISGNAVATLPILFIIFEVFFRDKSLTYTYRHKLRILILCTTLLISSLFIVTKYFEESPFPLTIFKFRGLSYLVVSIKAFAYYLKILYLPLKRGIFHPFGYLTFNIQKISPLFFLSLLVIAILVFSFFKFRRKFVPVSFGIMWFGLTFLPYSNLIPICNIVSERYLYLASVGFCIVIAALFLKVWKIVENRKLFRIIALIAIMFFLASYAYLTVIHNIDYTDYLTFWSSNLVNFPKGFVACNNLAGTFYQMGDYSNAIAYSYVNLMIKSDQPHVWCNLARVYRDIGNIQMAKSCYQEALKLDEDYFAAVKGLSELKKFIGNKQE